jgi:uncharacterized protein YegP (UPF0339 family)
MEGLEMIQLQVRRSTSPTQPYYCRAVESGNSAVLMTSETYRAKADAVHVANLMKAGCGAAVIVDLT